MTTSPPPSTSDSAPGPLADERAVDPSDEIDGQLQLARLRLTYGEGSPEPVTFRDWNIERKLGRGGMGAVYLATHRTLGRKVALKILAGDPHRDLVREARALAASPDPRVIQIFSVDDSAPPTIIIEMEYVDGQNLRAWRSDTNPSWRTVTEIFVAVAEGLAAIHRAGLVHRDIKPDNVLIERDRTTIKIVDFGLAVVPRTATLTPQSPPPTTASLALRFTAEGALVGTHGYIAPEVHGGDDATPQSDQFAFASAFFEALFGVLPFEGTSPAMQAEALRHGTFTVAIDGRLPAWLAATLRRALAFDPAKRFASMDDLAAHLRRGLARRRRALLGLGVLTILATGASFSWALKPPQDDPCARAGEPMQALWPAANRPALVTTDEAPGPTASARDLLVRTVDRRSAVWIDARIRHCAAERRAPLLDLEARALNRRQRACLDQSRSDLGTLLGALRHAPQTWTAAHLLDAAAAVEALPSCDDRRALANWPEPSTAAVDASAELAAILALEVGSDFAEAEARARALAARPDLPLASRAQALYRLGHILGRQHRFSAAFAALDDARNDAWVIGHEALTCRAAAHQAKLAANIALDPQASLRELRFAEACAKRTRTNTPLLDAELLEARGLLALAAGDLAQARTWHTQALALRRRLFGDDHPDVAKSLHNLANAIAEADPTAPEARRLYAEAIALRERLLGPQHPDVADILFDQSKCLPPAEALASLERALAIYDRAPGRHFALRANIHLALADLARSDGDLGRAAEHLTAARALQASDPDLPPHHLDRARLYHLEGVILFLGHDFPSARAALSRAIALYRRRDPESQEALAALPQWIEASVALQDAFGITAEARESGPALRAHLAQLPPIETGKLAWYIADAFKEIGATEEGLPFLRIALAAYQSLGDSVSAAELDHAIAALPPADAAPPP